MGDIKSFYNNVVGELQPLRENYKPIAIGDIRSVSDKEWVEHWRPHGSGWRNPSKDNVCYLERAYGGSDMGIIMRCSHFKTRLDLWAAKTNAPRSFEREGNGDAKELGHIYETPTAIKYHTLLRRHGVHTVAMFVEGKVYKPDGTLLKNPDGSIKDVAASMMMYRDGRKKPDGSFLYPWALANCDGIITDVIDGRKVTGGLEIKTTSARNIAVIEDWKNGHIPEAYYWQITYYMAILNVAFFDICCSWGQTFDDMAIVRIYRNYDEEDKLFKAVSEFDDYVAQGIEPDASLEAPELLNSFYYEKFGPAVESAPMVELPESFRNIVAQALQIDEEVKKAQELVSEAEAKKAAIYSKLQPVFGSSMYGQFKWSDGEIVSLTLKTPMRRAEFDEERFKKEHPAEYEQCKKFSAAELNNIDKKLKREYTLPAKPNTEDKDKNPTFAVKMKKIK